MLLKDAILANVEQLPIALQEEMLHYSEYLLSRHRNKNFPAKSEKRWGFGVLKGKIWIADDFDEPLRHLWKRGNRERGRRIDNLWIRIDFNFNFWRCL